MRAILLLLLTLPLWAACPTDSGYTKTCFVSLTGNNTTGDGTIGNPYRTVDKAMQTVAAQSGSTIYLRGGRWTAIADLVISEANHFSSTAAEPLTICGFPGEIVIQDGSSMANSAVFFPADDAAAADTPPYSNTIDVDNVTFCNFRVENWPRQWLWMWMDHEGIRVKNVNYHGSIGPQYANCKNCSIDGSVFNIRGTNPALNTTQGHAVDCTVNLPPISEIPWRGTGLVPEGHSTNSGVPNYWQLHNSTPRIPGNKAVGCVGFRFDAFTAMRTLSNSSDTVGIETGTRVQVINTEIKSPKYLGLSAGTDNFDMKGFDVTFNNVKSYFGKNGVKAWGKYIINGLFANQTPGDSGEAALTFAGALGTRAGAFPSAEAFNTIKWADNDADGDAFVTFADLAFANGPAPGQEVLIEDVPGCTSINKRAVIHPTKGTLNARHSSLYLQNLDGTQLSCNAPYDDSADQRQTHATTATFAGGGGSGITLAAAIPSNTAWSRPVSKVNNRVRFTTTGTLPSGLTPGADYYIKTISGTALTVTATPQAGLGGTAAMTFADTGSGTHTATILDDYNSYGGKMKIPDDLTANDRDWGSKVVGATAISTRNLSMDLAQLNVSTGFSGKGNKFDFQGLVSYALREDKITQTEMYFGGPRTIFNATDNYVYLAYYDVAYMDNDDRVAFRCTAVPQALGPGGGLSIDTEYFIINTDASGKRFQVSLTSGGSAVDITSAGTGKCWGIFRGFSSEYIEVEQNIPIASDTFTIDTQGGAGSQAPYPFNNATTYTVTDISTVAVNGTNVYIMRVNAGAGNISHTTKTEGPHWWVHSTGANSSVDGVVQGWYLRRAATTTNNLYYTAAPTGDAIFRYEGDAGWSNLGTAAVADTAELQGLEGSTSCIADPALDVDTGRATASSPACMFNKGYYNAFHKLISKADTTAIIYNKFPAPCRFETCTLVVDDDADMLSPVETITITSGGQDQYIKVGETTPLTANTTYYYGWQQGYDTGGTSFTTDATLSGTGTLSISLGPGDANASVAYGLTPSLGTSGDTDAGCTSGCTLTTAGIAKGTYYYQVTRGGVAGQLQLVTIKE